MSLSLYVSSVRGVLSALRAAVISCLVVGDISSTSVYSDRIFSVMYRTEVLVFSKLS